MSKKSNSQRHGIRGQSPQPPSCGSATLVRTCDGRRHAEGAANRAQIRQRHSFRRPFVSEETTRHLTGGVRMSAEVDVRTYQVVQRSPLCISIPWGPKPNAKTSVRLATCCAIGPKNSEQVGRVWIEIQSLVSRRQCVLKVFAALSKVVYCFDILYGVSGSSNRVRTTNDLPE